MRTLWVTVFLFVSLRPVYARPDTDSNPFACWGRVSGQSLASTRTQIIDIPAGSSDVSAEDLCVQAELRKRDGDYEASEYFERAIQAAPDEPGYEFFYAEYLRNFRGAGTPLFPEAERHYHQALAKLQRRKERQQETNFDDDLGRQIARGLVELYQRDGLPLMRWNGADHEGVARASLYLSSLNQYARATTDFGEVDDVRDFTSEALFSESDIRLNRGLTRSELRRIARVRYAFESVARLRLRAGSLPVLDAFVRYRDIDNVQITQFFDPTEFNDVKAEAYGVALEKPLDFGPLFDAFVRAAYSHVEREGLIEFLPRKNEDVEQFEATTQISRFVGPDKLLLTFNYVYQSIDPAVSDPVERHRQILAGEVRYLLFRSLRGIEDPFDKRFEARGLEFFGGISYDRERFGNVDIVQYDYYGGVNATRISPWAIGAPFDVALQGTVFTHKVDGDSTQDNRQYRTTATLLFRLIDQERLQPTLHAVDVAFLHLAVPFRHDVAIDGPRSFENFRVGASLNAKIFSVSAGWTTLLASISYEYQRFYRIGDGLHLAGVNVSLGF